MHRQYHEFKSTSINYKINSPRLDSQQNLETMVKHPQDVDNIRFGIDFLISQKRRLDTQENFNRIVQCAPRIRAVIDAVYEFNRKWGLDIAEGFILLSQASAHLGFVTSIFLKLSEAKLPLNTLQNLKLIVQKAQYADKIFQALNYLCLIKPMLYTQKIFMYLIENAEIADEIGLRLYTLSQTKIDVITPKNGNLFLLHLSEIFLTLLHLNDVKLDSPRNFEILFEQPDVGRVFTKILNGKPLRQSDFFDIVYDRPLKEAISDVLGKVHPGFFGRKKSMCDVDLESSSKLIYEYTR